jgi:peptidoglycan/xylan/chitin deacetylase (PgdA/CDA1 family)/GT2 family glycosyltransferase
VTGSGTSVVITCHGHGRELRETVDSVTSQTAPSAEIVVVDDGSEDWLTRQILASLEQGAPPLRVIRTERQGPARAANVGIGSTTAPLVLLLDGDYRLEPDYLETATTLLADRPDLSFAGCSTHRSEPAAHTLGEVLGRGACGHVSSVFRRELWERTGGFDEQLTGYEDVDFWVRAAELGFRGVILDEALVRRGVRESSNRRATVLKGEHLQAKMMVLDKHLDAASRRGEDVFASLLGFQRELAADARSLEQQRVQIEQAIDVTESEISQARDALAARGIAEFSWGVLDTVDELDAGDVPSADGAEDLVSEQLMRQAVDELAPSKPPRRTITIQPGDPWPDTRRPKHDLIIVAGALERAEDPAAALARCRSALRPGGQLVVAASTMALGQDQQRGFTQASLRALLCGGFPPAQVRATSYGNFLTCLGSVSGTAVAGLPHEALEFIDPEHPTIVAASARLPAADRSRSSRRRPGAPALLPPDSAQRRRGLILAYHRIAELHPDTHGLCTPPERFAAQMELLAENFQPLSLRDLVAQATAGELVPGAVAVTFDGGYLDNLEIASPALIQVGIPATFFVGGAPPGEPCEAWPDTLERILVGDEPVPDRLVLELGERRIDMPTRTVGQRHSALLALHEDLVDSGPGRVRTVVGQIADWSACELAVRDSHRLMTDAELLELCEQPGHQVGAHGLHRRRVPSLPPDVQAGELRRCKTQLEELLGRSVDSIAYPHGACDLATTQIAQEIGFTIGCTFESDPVTPDSDPLRLPRINAQRQELRSFRLLVEHTLAAPV